MPEELKIVIEADVSKAQAGLESVSLSAQKTADNLTKISPAATNASTGLDKIGASATKIAPAASSLSTATNQMADGLNKIPSSANNAGQSLNTVTDVINNFSRQGKLSIGVVEQAMVQLRTTIKQTTDTTELKKLNDAYTELQRKLNSLKLTGGLEQSLGGVTRSTRIAHGELDQMSRTLAQFATGNGRAIDGLSQIAFSFEQLIGKTGSARIALATLGETLLSPAGLLVALSALAPLVEEIGGKLLEGFGKGSKEIQEAADRSKKLKDAISGIFEGTAKEVTDVTSLIAVLRSETETRERKLAAIKELNQIAPETFNNLKLEGDSVKNLDQDYKNYLQNIQTVIAAKIKQAQLENLITQILKLQGVTLTQQEKAIADFGKNLAKAISPKLPQDQRNIFLEKIQDDAKKTTSEINNIQTQIESLSKDLTELSTGIKIKTDTTDAHNGIDELQRRIITLAKEAEKVFNVPLKLRFDDTDLDIDKLAKATEVLKGIKDFTIKARVDIDLPDIKELPKEQVEKLFINVPDALQDAINKGIVAVPQGFIIPIKLDLDPEHAFDKDITDLEQKFFKAGLEIPAQILVDIADAKLKGVDLFEALADAFKPEELKKKFKETTDFLSKIKIGVQLGDLEDKADKVRGSLGGISEEAGIAAAAIGGALTESVDDFIKAIQQGQNPIKAFFDSIIHGLEQVIVKLIATAIEAAILNALFPGIGGFGSAFKGLLGFEKGGRYPVGQDIIVGERGPEIVRFDRPGTVIPNHQTESILSSSVSDYQNIKSQFIELKREFYSHRDQLNSLRQSFSASIADRFSSLKESVHSKISNALSYISSSQKEVFSSIKNISENITEKSFSIKDSFIKEDVSKLKESFSTITSSIQKLSEKISVEKTFSIEKIVNNNFFSSQSSLSQSNFTKSLSVERIADLLHIPKFATGGAVFAPTLALLGEGFGISRSNPEFVGTAKQLAGISGGSNSTVDINVNVNSADEFMRGFVQIVKSQIRSTGKNPLG